MGWVLSCMQARCVLACLVLMAMPMGFKPSYYALDALGHVTSCIVLVFPFILSSNQSCRNRSSCSTSRCQNFSSGNEPVSSAAGCAWVDVWPQVLPRVLEQIISCKDDIAQQYLFQVGPGTCVAVLADSAIMWACEPRSHCDPLAILQYTVCSVCMLAFCRFGSLSKHTTNVCCWLLAYGMMSQAHSIQNITLWRPAGHVVTRQAVIQVFPDAFHLGTLGALLDALPELQPGVKVHTVMGSLMDRLAK